MRLDMTPEERKILSARPKQMTPEERKSAVEKILQLRDEIAYRLPVIQDEFPDSPQIHKKYGDLMSHVVDLSDALDATLSKLAKKLAKGAV